MIIIIFFILSSVPLLYCEASMELVYTDSINYTVSGDTLDIGEISFNDSIEVLVKMKNSGNTKLEINRLRSTCPCFKIEVIQSVIKSMTMADVFKLKVLSQGLKKYFCKKIYVHTNIPNKEIAVIYVKGKVSKK